MDNSVLYALMIAVAVSSALVPLAVFLGLGSLLGTGSSDPRLFVTFLLLTAVVMYLASFGAFVLIQRLNCGKVGSYSQSAANAGLSTGIQMALVFVASFVPFLRNAVSGLFSPLAIPEDVAQAFAYSYYCFWGALFGTSLGGSLSAICPAA